MNGREPSTDELAAARARLTAAQPSMLRDKDQQP
jgi:hypothetical protein